MLADPTAYFHIVSKDKGYYLLIDHLRSSHIHARRHDDFSTLTFSYKAREAEASTKVAVSGAGDMMNQVLERLRKNVANRPKKKATLLSHLKSSLCKGGTEGDADKVFEKLRKAGHLVLDEKGGITYRV